jgi:protein pelota
MRILKRDLKHGKITLRPENSDDLWHIYNILQLSDIVSGSSFRRIRITTSDETARPDKGERKPIRLELEVEKISFHPFTDALRIKGIITQSSEESVHLGSYHTINLTPQTVITIKKGYWPKHMLQRLSKAAKAGESEKIVILAIEDGSVQLALVSSIGVNPGPYITEAIPGKRHNPKQHDIILQQFFNKVGIIVREIAKKENPRRIIIAGPGLIKQYFANYLRKLDPQLGSKITLETVTSGTIQGVNEALKKGAFEKALQESHLIMEMQLIDELLARIGRDDSLVAFGFDAVEIAIQSGAVDTLLVADIMLRVQDVEKRKHLEGVMKMVEQFKGSIVIISTLHNMGKQLQALGGIAALLRFKLPQN